MFDVHLPKTVRDFIFQNKMFSMSKKHMTETNWGSGITKFIVLLNEASRLCDLDYKFCNLFSFKVSLRKKLMGVLTFIFQTGIQPPPHLLSNLFPSAHTRTLTTSEPQRNMIIASDRLYSPVPHGISLQQHPCC